MNKQEFLDKLREGLSGLPQDDIEERLSFYAEMIDDPIEDGLSESEAVEKIGDIDEIVSQIVSETPLSKLVKKRIKPKRTIRWWEIVLLILGSPIWLSLVIAAITVILSLYIVLWSLIVSVWAIFASLVACAIGGIVVGITTICRGGVFGGIAVIGASMVCAGLSVFMLYGCCAATKGIIILTKKIALGIKKCFIKKENYNE